jgi:pyruvyl transferase EpsO
MTRPGTGQGPTDDARPTGTSEAVVSSLRNRYVAVMDGLLPSPSEVVLIDYPNHSNVGDCAIWLGERQWLRESGHQTVYVADVMSYSPRSVTRAASRDAVILLHGGGNLGDLWPHHHALRERVLRDFPGRRIVQLPQTAWFRDERAARRFAELAGRCDDLAIVARDSRSQQQLTELCGRDVALAPDAAFMLSGTARTREPDVETLWLTRTDTETVVPLRLAEARSARATDWLDESADRIATVSLPRVRKTVSDIGRRSRRVPPASPLVQRGMIPAFDLLARRRLASGLDLLSAGRTVVTDRLHAHILSMLLGIPNVAVDTGYGKLSAFADTWTGGCEDCRITFDRREVDALLREIAPGPVASTPLEDQPGVG